MGRGRRDLLDAFTPGLVAGTLVACSTPGAVTTPEPSAKASIGTASIGTASIGTASSAYAARCPVTEPTRRADYPAALRRSGTDSWYGHGALWLDLGNFAHQAPEPEPAGGLAIKHAWWTGDDDGAPTDTAGPPRVTATRLDGPGHAAGSSGGYATATNLSWWPTTLTFSAAGCWRISGRLGGDRLEAVVAIPPP